MLSHSVLPINTHSLGLRVLIGITLYYKMSICDGLHCQEGVKLSKGVIEIINKVAHIVAVWSQVQRSK